jgi:hypothetical protein
MSGIIGTLNTLSETVHAASRVGQATVETAEQGVLVAKNTGKIVNTGLETVDTTLENSGKLANTAILSADETLGNTNAALNTSLNSLNEQLGNINQTTTKIFGIANESLEKSSSNVSNIVGNTTEVGSKITTFTSDSVSFGQTIVGSLFSIVEYPFSKIKGKIEEIKKYSSLPTTKIKDIKNTIINNFSSIRDEVIKGFEKDLNNLINNINNLVKIYKKISCKKSWLVYDSCDKDIIEKINNINNIKESLNLSINNDVNDVKLILNRYGNKVNAIKLIVEDNNVKLNDKISDQDFDLILEKLQNESQEIQSELLSESIEKIGEIIQIKYQNKIKLIGDDIEFILNEISQGLNKDKQTNEISGGKKNKSKKQRKSKSKKKRKNKSKTKKSKK